MRIWKIAALAVLALSSVAAVAPTKSELEEMYSKAFRAFDANDFSQALKELDAIDSRQPDLAASQNLRGVILMRQGIYDKAEAALVEAARIDPKFWNARFNLAEIPFLKKDWAEARKRFEQLLSGSGSDLASEAKQLIQYKILLTYLLEGKENMVDSILAKLELSPVTPAVDYVKAAVALQHKNEKEGKDWIAVAEKNFSPQLNKLFAESLYEAGWLQKPAGQARASLPIMTAAERLEKAKAVGRSKFEQAQQALRQRDFATARKLVDEADQAEPNQPATLNLRGEILMGQKEFDQAEATLRKAAKLDPKLREAQYNLAQIPFKKKEYEKARERFEALFRQTPGGDKNQASELIKFKIFMTLLLEGKESRAQAMMEQFQFTGDTPALYYAQSAWEYKHDNSEKAADWTASAQKIYSPALNNVFADAFYDVGWMQPPAVAAAPLPAFDTGSVVASQTESSPAVEPSPIPDSVVAASKQAEGSKSELLASSAPANSPAATETTSEGAVEQPPVSAPSEPVGAATSTQPVEAPATVSAPGSSGESAGVAASPAQAAIASSAPVVGNQQAPAGETKPSGAAAAATSATKLSPAGISQPGVVTSMSRQTWLVGGLLLAGVFLLAWVIVPEIRRRTFSVPSFLQIRSIASSRIFKPRMAAAEKGLAVGGDNGFFGGPRQVSLRLAASKPSLRRGALPTAKASGTFDRLANMGAKPLQAAVHHTAEPTRELSPPAESLFESVGPVLEQTADTSPAPIPYAPEMAEISAASELSPTSAIAEGERSEIPFESVGSVLEQTADTSPAPILHAPEMAEISAASELSPTSAIAAEERSEIPGIAEEIVLPAVAEPQTEFESEPIQQEQPAPYEAAIADAQSPVAEAVAEPAFDFPNAISTEPVFPPTTTPVTMPETTQIPIAPVNKPPPTAVTKQPAGTMQSSVQLTFSFEIAAMQLTPTFKMGVLQVRPTSKIVTMRLPSSQHLQSTMNFQVNFEIAKIQPVGGALGNIRMTPSQQKPTTVGSPSFAVAGLQLVPNFEATPVQLTPSQQGQAAVFVTVPFEITTLEFSPSLEIASVVLNSNSKQVFVQLPGTGPSPSEGAPMFEIVSLQMSESGDIGMMQLNLLGHGPDRT
jgi:Flp pilus assembly protein TadD